MKLTDLQDTALRCLAIASQNGSVSTDGVNLFLTEYAPSALPQLRALAKKGLAKGYEEGTMRCPRRYWEITDAGTKALASQ